MAPPKIPAEKRFEAKYEQITESGCWLWTDALDKDGYGVLRINRRNVRAHRYSYEKHVKPIPNGFCVLHKCDVPSCVNPFHLSIGTIAENNADRDRKGRCRSRVLPCYGEKNNSAKLNNAMVREIRANQPKITKQNALKYGVSIDSLRRVLKNETWTHI